MGKKPVGANRTSGDKTDKATNRANKKGGDKKPTGNLGSKRSATKQRKT